jgi:hypothetical protein
MLLVELCQVGSTRKFYGNQKEKWIQKALEHVLE